MAYRDAVLGTSGLVGYWRLGDTGTTATDSSGNARHGTITGATVGATSLLASDTVDTALSFDGVNDAVTIADSTNMSGTAGLTVEAWIHATVWLTGAPIINRRTTGNVGGYVLEMAATTGTMNFYLYSGSWQLVTSTGWSLNTTYHIVATHDGVTARIYRNGIEVASTPVAGSIGAPTANIVIGQSISTTTRVWTGRIDEVAVYNVALGATTVSDHYTTGTTVGSPSRTALQTAALLTTNTRTASQTVAIVTTSSRLASQTGAIAATSSRTAVQAAAVTTTSQRSAAQAASIKTTTSRTATQGAAIATSATPSRTASQAAAILTTLARAASQAAALQTTNSRTTVQSVAIAVVASPSRTALQTAAILTTQSRVAAQLAAIRTSAERAAAQSAAVSTTSTRTAPQSTAVLTTGSRTAPQTAALVVTSTRIALQTVAITISSLPDSAALETVTWTREPPETVIWSTAAAFESVVWSTQLAESVTWEQIDFKEVVHWDAQEPVELVVWTLSR